MVVRVSTKRVRIFNLFSLIKFTRGMIGKRRVIRKIEKRQRGGRKGGGEGGWEKGGEGVKESRGEK